MKKTKAEQGESHWWHCADRSEVTDQGLGLARGSTSRVEETDHERWWWGRSVLDIHEASSTARELCK